MATICVYSHATVLSAWLGFAKIDILTESAIRNRSSGEWATSVQNIASILNFGLNKIFAVFGAIATHIRSLFIGLRKMRFIFGSRRSPS